MNTKTNLNLIFLHIPKNGGMTLHNIIEKNYNPTSIFSIKVIDHIKLNTDDFINLSPNERKDIQVLKGHMLFGLHTYFDEPSQYVTFLRKPEDRLYSFYHYVKKRPQHRLYPSIFGTNLSFDDFIRTIDAGDLHNAQIRWISGINQGNEDEMLEMAKKNIQDHFVFVGLQEHYDLSIILLRNLLQWKSIYYKTKNKGTYHDKNISKETLAIIKSKNKGDYELYDFIEKRLKQNVTFTNYMALIRFKIANAYFNSKLYNSTKMKQLRKKFN